MHKVAKDEKPGINFHILYMLVFEMILYACSGTKRPYQRFICLPTYVTYGNKSEKDIYIASSQT